MVSDSDRRHLGRRRQPLGARQQGGGSSRSSSSASSSRGSASATGSAAAGGSSSRTSSRAATQAAAASSSSSRTPDPSPTSSADSSNSQGIEDQNDNGDSQPGGSANGILTDPASYTNVSRIVLHHNGGAGQLIYTMPLMVENQMLNVQLDTGTSDLWLASTACKSDSCSSGNSYQVALFDPAGSPDQRIAFSLEYVNGAASGTIRTSNITVSGTNLTLIHQAFGSAITVSNEPMDTGNFTGIIGLGPPAGSALQDSLYNNTGNPNPLNDVSDAASTGSLLAGIWTGRPLGARYISLGLQRLPSEGGKGDSVLTISELDPGYASNRTEMQYTPAIGPDGQSGVPAHWSTYLTQIEIDVGGQTLGVPPGGSFGTQYPIATFSSGAPVSLAPASVLNVIYGAYGYQPGSDGGYYVPCDLMMNITLYLGTSSVKVPIHPLDASIYQVNGDPKYCFGGIQSITGANGAVAGQDKLQADFVIGAPFMRSIYTVFSCDDLVNKPTNDTNDSCAPQIGLNPLVKNVTDAQHQFYQVRVLKQSLGSDPTDITASSQRGLSPGLKALIGVLSAVAGIAAIMVLVVFLAKRQRQKRRALAIRSGLEKDASSRSASIDEQAVWSETQMQKAREVHRMHGVFDEDVLPDSNHLAAGATPDFGAASMGSAGQHDSVGVLSGSSPYYDARRIKAAYLQRHPSFDTKPQEEQQHILSTMPQEEQQQYTSMLASHVEEEEEDTERGTSLHTSHPSSSSSAHLLSSPQHAQPQQPQQPQPQQPQQQSYSPQQRYSPQQEYQPSESPVGPSYLAPAADMRMKPTFHQGPSPVPSPQRSTDDFFESQGSQNAHMMRVIHQDGEAR